MKKQLYLVLFTVFIASMFFQNVNAGNENQPAGARMVALGNAYTGIRSNFWSLFNNPAGIAGITDIQGGVFMERRFLLNEMNSGAMGVVYPFLDNHVAGLDFSGFGFGGYTESRIGLCYGTNLLDRFSLGAKFNYVHTTIQNYGSASAFFVNAGLNAMITENLSVGFRVYNANQAKINREIEEKIPTTLNVGVAYQLSDKVLFVADLEKQVNYTYSFRGGIEYEFIDNFHARVGAQSNPTVISGGVGVNWKGLDIDFASSYHSYLGYTPALSLNYTFGSKGEKTEKPVSPETEE